MKNYWQRLRQRLLVWLAGNDTWLINVEIYPVGPKTEKSVVCVPSHNLYIIGNSYGHPSTACIVAKVPEQHVRL